MKKIYLFLIAMIFAVSVSAQPYVYITYQTNGLNIGLQGNVSNPSLASSMTFNWDVGGYPINGYQNVSTTFSSGGTYLVVLTATYQSQVLTDSVMVTVAPYPCGFWHIVGGVTDAHSSISTDGSIFIYHPNYTWGSNYFSYSWSPTGDTIKDLSNIGAGSYTLVVTDSLMCTDSATFIVGIDSINNPCSMYITANYITPESGFFLNDGAIDLNVSSGNGPYLYTWYKDSIVVANTEDLTQITGGDYTVEVIDQDSCIESATFHVWTDSTNCNIRATYGIIYPTSANAQDGSIDITMYNYIYSLYYYWTDGTNYYYTEDLNQIDTGIYYLTAHDGVCFYSHSFYLYPDSLNTIATYSYYIDTCLNQIASASIISYSVNSNNEITVVWEFVEVGTGNTSTITVTYLSNTAFLNGRYQFVLSINCNGAKSIVTDTYSDYLDVVTAIDEYSNNNLYKIYPNPANETISISLTSKTIENTNIYIYNSLGMIVYEKEIEINSGINTYQIPLINIQNGIYFININGETQSFIKE